MTGMGMLRRQSGHPEIATPMTRPDDADGLAARRLAFERLTDQRLLRAVAGHLPFVRWIGDYPLSGTP